MESPGSITLNIKSTLTPTSRSISISPQSTTVSQLKSSVLLLLGPSTSDRYLRLIAAGKLLTPDSSLLSSFSLQSGDFIHAVLANNPPANRQPGVQAMHAAGQSKVDYRGGGDDYSSGEEEDGGGGGRSGERSLLLGGRPPRPSSLASGSSTARRRGFDILRSAGLGREQVGAMRAAFSEEVSAYERVRRRGDAAYALRSGRDATNAEGAGGPQGIGSDGGTIAVLPGGQDIESQVQEESEPDIRLRMEEEWMFLQGPGSEFVGNVTGISRPRSIPRFGMFGGPQPFFSRGGAAASEPSSSAPPPPSSFPSDPSEAHAEIQRLLLAANVRPPSPLPPYRGAAPPFAGMTLQGFREELARRRAAAAQAASNVQVGPALGGEGYPGDNNDEFASGQEGTTRDFFVGYMLGYFVGFFLIFWVWLPTVPYRQKLGILCGIATGIIINMEMRGSAVNQEGT